MPSDTELQANIKIASVRKVNRKHGVIFHPTLGYPIPPPIPLTIARRNARERSRVKSVNNSYESLRAHVPAAAKAKRMSKVDVIKHTIQYIHKLQEIVNSQIEDHRVPQSYNHGKDYTTYCQNGSFGFSSTTSDSECSIYSPISEEGHVSSVDCFQFPTSEPALSPKLQENNIPSQQIATKDFYSRRRNQEDQKPLVTSCNEPKKITVQLENDLLDVIADWQDS